MIEKINFECDLHCHTNRSDGNSTPKEVIDLAASRGLKVLAITDHDIVPAEYVETEDGKIKVEEYGKSKGIEVISGIEVSCDTNVDDVHILGLCCDFTYDFFQKLPDFVFKGKLDSSLKMIDELVKDGYEISWEEILYNDGNPLMQERVQKKSIFDMLAKKGYVKTWQEGKLFVQANDRYNVRREKPDPIKTIEHIHNAGGIAVLAHPYLIKDTVRHDGKEMTRFEYIDMLVEAGLDGIEGCYTYNKTSYGGTLTKEEIELQIRERYEDKVKFISGGSDYHADEKKGVENARMQGECGVTMEYFDEKVRGVLGM